MTPSPSPLYLMQTPDGPCESMRRLLGGLIDHGTVDAVMVQVAQPGSERLTHALVADRELLQRAYPLSPLMPVNAARMVSRLASRASDRRIAAVLRPCEERALMELVKLKQATLEGLLPLVVDCPGAVEREELERLAGGPDGLEGASRAVRDAVLEPGAPGPELRAGCAMCSSFVPGRLAGISVELYGHDGQLGVRVDEGLADRVDPTALGLERAAGEPEDRERIVSALAEHRRQALTRELEAIAHLADDPQGLLDEVAACIRCGACRQACPICFCRRCTFEMPTHEHEPADFTRWAARKGAARLPEDVLLYHLTRLAHVGVSCATCGSCESACPQGIRLTRLFAHVGPKVRAPFGYEPGRDLDDPLPLSAFEREELEPR